VSLIPDKFLEHRIDVEPILEVGSSVGRKFGDTLEDVHAIVVDKRKLVVDQRVDSDTKGQQIMASTHVLVQPEDYAPPGSKVTVWKGTPMSRIGVVVATAYAEHSIAPSSAQMWLV
jgi:hypothetical protein